MTRAIGYGDWGSRLYSGALQLLHEFIVGREFCVRIHLKRLDISTSSLCEVAVFSFHRLLGQLKLAGLTMLSAPTFVDSSVRRMFCRIAPKPRLPSPL